QFSLFITTHKPDIIQFFLPSNYMHGAPIALLLGCRRLIMSRRSLNNYMCRAPSWMKWLELRLHPYMTAITGNSKAVVKQLVEEERAPPEKISLIYNGVPLPAL